MTIFSLLCYILLYIFSVFYGCCFSWLWNKGKVFLQVFWLFYELFSPIWIKWIEMILKMNRLITFVSVIWYKNPFYPILVHQLKSASMQEDGIPTEGDPKTKTSAGSSPQLWLTKTFCFQVHSWLDLILSMFYRDGEWTKSNSSLPQNNNTGTILNHNKAGCVLVLILYTVNKLSDNFVQ